MLSGGLLPISPLQKWRKEVTKDKINEKKMVDECHMIIFELVLKMAFVMYY